MADSMSEPVTRGELHEELATLRTELRTEISVLRAELRGPFLDDLRKEFATKRDLELWAGALERKFSANLDAKIQGLSKELAGHVQVILETVRRDNRVLDDMYADLPPRVAALEAKVLAPKRRRR